MKIVEIVLITSVVCFTMGFAIAFPIAFHIGKAAGEDEMLEELANERL